MTNRTGVALIVAAISCGAIGQTKEVAPPSNAQAVAIFSEAWKKHRPDFSVESIQVIKSEAKQYQDRRWIVYKLSITATGTDKGSREMYQKKYRCTPEENSSVLKLEAGNWVADQKMIQYVNESTQCSLAK